jgi:hypothetical protein
MQSFFQKTEKYRITNIKINQPIIGIKLILSFELL